jgi:hypothetical protein
MTLQVSAWWVLEGKLHRMEPGLTTSVFYIKTNIYKVT